jgi:hypothetical protein
MHGNWKLASSMYIIFAKKCAVRRKRKLCFLPDFEDSEEKENSTDSNTTNFQLLNPTCHER